MTSEQFTFDDVLIKPRFSRIDSRKNVDLSTQLNNEITLKLPIISSNMDSITGPKMTRAMHRAGGMGILHRFMSIEENVEAWANSDADCGVSVGLGEIEQARARALVNAGAYIICVDVAHGAQLSVTKQVTWLRKTFGNDIYIIVGNFATLESILAFEDFCDGYLPDIYKVGIGPGSVCSTRIKTGIGVSQLSAIIDCASRGHSIIADGGIKTPGDIAKALAVEGVKAVMVGGLLAGTDETPGEKSVIAHQENSDHTWTDIYGKTYRGSASSDYGNGWKTSEGIIITTPCKGPVGPILKDMEGGLRSAFTYVGASNLEEFQNKAEFHRVSRCTAVENRPHYEEIKG